MDSVDKTGNITFYLKNVATQLVCVVRSKNKRESKCIIPIFMIFIRLARVVCFTKYILNNIKTIYAFVYTLTCTHTSAHAHMPAPFVVGPA